MKLASLSGFLSSSRRAKPRKQLFFRTILVESLEARKLLAVDIADVATASLSITPSIESPATLETDTYRETLNGYQQNLDDAVARFAPSLVDDSADKPDAVSQYVKQVQSTNSMNFADASNAAWQDFEKQLGKATGPIDTSSIDAMKYLSQNTDSIQQSMLGGTLPNSQGREADTDALVAAALGSSQNVFGQFIAKDADGLPNPGWLPTEETIAEEPANSFESEGEEELPNPIAVPTEDFPSMSLGSVPLDQFVPAANSSGTTKSHFGGFTDNTTAANANLNLPGLSWTRVTTTNWIDATHWSVTETLVLAFNFSYSNTISSDLDTEDDPPTTTPSHFATGSGSATLTASRSGHLFLTLYASRGITTDPAAGVAWSVNASFSDDVTFGVTASASTAMTPNTAYVDPSWISSTTSPPPTVAPVPRNFSSQSSWSASIGIHLFKSGTMVASGTPSIITVTDTPSGTDIQTSLTYSNNRQGGVSLSLASAAANSEQSGDLDDSVPIDGILPNAMTSGGSNGGSGTLPSDAPSVPVPFEGSGHSMGSSSNVGSTTTNSGTSSTSLSAKMRSNGKLTELSGMLRDQMNDALADQGGDNVMMSLRFVDGDASNNYIAAISVGRNLSSTAAASAASTLDVDLGLNSTGGIIGIPGDSQADLEASDSSRDTSFEYLRVTGRGTSMSATGGTTWNATITSNTITQGVSSANADAAAEYGEPGSATAHGDATLRKYNSKTYESNQTVLNFYPDSTATAADGSPAFERTVFHNFDQWSFDRNGTGVINNSLAADGSVNSDATSNEVATEKLLYQSNVNYVKQYITPTAETRNSTQRSANYQTQIVSTASYDSDDPDAPNPEPVRSGDSRVQVTGTQDDFHKKRSGPSVAITSLYRNLETGLTTIVSPFMMVDENGEMTHSRTFYEPGWDPRTVYEHGLDGSPVPNAGGMDNGVNPTLPSGYVYPSVNTAGKTWIDWIGGRRGDSGDQAINFAAGFADNVTLNAAWLWRNQLGTDTVDYDTGSYSAGGWTAFVLQLPGAVKSVASGVGSLRNAANNFDEMGNCANWFTKVVNGGCFVAGTLISILELPYSPIRQHALWAESTWLEELTSGASVATSPVATHAIGRTLMPIEQVPLGARIPTKNPRPWEYDDSLSEPDEESWGKISIVIERSDGGIVDVELMRPRSWMESNGIRAGLPLPVNVPELEIAGIGYVQTIDECPAIAGGEGSVITGRFVTREVNAVVRVQVRGEDGTIDIVEGTHRHPVWSIKQNDWVPLGELIEGDQLRGADCIATVLAVSIEVHNAPVYNIEVDGEHVYEVGKLAILVHNSVVECIGALRAGQTFTLVQAESSGLLRMSGSTLEVVSPYVQLSGFLHFVDDVRKVATAMNANTIVIKNVAFGFGPVPGKAAAMREFFEKIGTVTKTGDDIFAEVFEIVIKL